MIKPAEFASRLTGTNYGVGFSYNALTGATTNADSSTLVNSPFVAACASCHDSSIAIDHMQTNGGAFYVGRDPGPL